MKFSLYFLMIFLLIVGCDNINSPNNPKEIQLNLNRSVLQILNEDSVEIHINIPFELIEYLKWSDTLDTLNSEEKYALISIYTWNRDNRIINYFESVKYGWLANNFNMYQYNTDHKFTLMEHKKDVQFLVLYVEINKQCIYLEPIK